MLMKLTRLEQETLKERSSDIQFIPTRESIDFIDKCATLFPKLVIIDVDLVKDQLQKLLNILQTLHGNIKIILALSPENLNYCHHIPRLGEVSLLLKPFSSDNVVQLSESLLKTKKEDSV